MTSYRLFKISRVARTAFADGNMPLRQTIHPLWDSVQNENSGLPVQNLQISRKQQQGPSQCEALCPHTGCTPLKQVLCAIHRPLCLNCSASDYKTEVSDPSWLLGHQFCIIHVISYVLIRARPCARL